MGAKPYTPKVCMYIIKIYIDLQKCRGSEGSLYTTPPTNNRIHTPNTPHLHHHQKPPLRLFLLPPPKPNKSGYPCLPLPGSILFAILLENRESYIASLMRRGKRRPQGMGKETAKVQSLEGGQVGEWGKWPPLLSFALLLLGNGGKNTQLGSRRKRGGLIEREREREKAGEKAFSAFSLVCFSGNAHTTFFVPLSL